VDLNTKDKIDACLKQAEMGAAKVANRQIYEWKVTLLIWGGLLAAAKFMREAQVDVPTGILIAGGFAFLAIYAFVWLRGIWIGNKYDKEWDIFYRLEAAKLIRSDSHTVAPPPLKGTLPLDAFIADYSPRFQFFMTTLIVAATISVIASNRLGTDQKNRQQCGPVNESQPICSDTKGTSSAAGSRH
jgi:hypothetical protein